jgi:hypothetical protein
MSLFIVFVCSRTVVCIMVRRIASGYSTCISYCYFLYPIIWFQRLEKKIGTYVEYLTRISSEYFTSTVLPSLTSTAGRTSRVFLAYVIPWINKASLVLYIARSVPCHDRLIWSSKAAIEFVFVIEAGHYRVIRGRESVSDSISAIEASAWGTVYALHRRPFTTCTIIPLCSYWGHGQEFHIPSISLCVLVQLAAAGIRRSRLVS